MGRPGPLGRACLPSRATWRLIVPGERARRAQAAARLCKAAPARRAHEICGVFCLQAPRRFSPWRPAGASPTLSEACAW